MPHRLTVAAALAALITLTGCETPTSQRYAVSAENNVAIKALSVSGIAVGAFAEPLDFWPACRLVGDARVADGITHAQYIRRALLSELLLAGAASPGPARVTLTGLFDKIEFSSGGRWVIDMTLKSSNGRNLRVVERYEYDIGFMGTESCRLVAEAFPRAVQNLIGKAVRHPQFVSLVN